MCWKEKFPMYFYIFGQETILIFKNAHTDILLIKKEFQWYLNSQIVYLVITHNAFLSKELP